MIDFSLNKTAMYLELGEIRIYYILKGVEIALMFVSSTQACLIYV